MESARLMSTLTPGPMVEVTVILRRKMPFAAAGLAFLAHISAEKILGQFFCIE
jgi:hypothetical protein